MDEQVKRRSTEAGTELNGGVNMAFSVDLRYASAHLRFTTSPKSQFILQPGIIHHLSPISVDLILSRKVLSKEGDKSPPRFCPVSAKLTLSVDTVRVINSSALIIFKVVFRQAISS